MCCAWREAATFTSASWALVVPNSYMCLCAASAYAVTADMPHVDSKPASGDPEDRAVGASPRLRASPAMVIRATWHRPAAMAAAAWPTCTRYEEPPVSVESMYRG